MMIEMDNVSKTYYTREKTGLFRSWAVPVQAVSNLSLQLRPGEIVGLLGLNGAGKTTAIRMLSTLLDPTSGRITVDGMSMDRHRRDIQRQINMIAGGERMLYWRLSGRENLHYFGKLYGLGSAAVTETSERLLREVGLEEAADRPVEQYSKGMKQRLQIARGLINDPSYLFLDEPTLGLDAPIARQLRSTVSSLAKEQGKGILLTSHYLNEVEALCDRVYILNKGRLLLEDKTHAIVSRIAGKETAHVDVEGWSETLREDLDAIEELEPGQTLVVPAPDDDAKRCRISVVAASADMVVSRLLPWADRHGLKIVGFHSEKPSLEDAVIMLSKEEAV